MVGDNFFLKHLRINLYAHNRLFYILGMKTEKEGDSTPFVDILILFASIIDER